MGLRPRNSISNKQNLLYQMSRRETLKMGLFVVGGKAIERRGGRCSKWLHVFS
jgi:hypothetical protein